LILKPLYDWDDSNQRWVVSTSGGVHSGGPQNLPADNPHHWERHGNGWKNKYTDKVVAGEHNPVTGKVTWSKLTPYDWRTMLNSILLLSYSKHFCEYFGREKVWIERYVHEHVLFIGRLQKEHKSSCPWRVAHFRAIAVHRFLQGSHNENGVFVPKYPDKYKLVVQIELPERLSDPDHWGHLAWRFCQFMEAREKA
jgi:hypothetical protein